MSNYKKLGIVACALLILGVFVPFVSINFLGIKLNFTLIKGWKGAVILILALLNLFIMFFDKIKEKVNSLEKIEKIKNNKVIMIVYAVALAIDIITGISAISKTGSEYVSLSVGFFSILAGGIIGLVSAWKMKDQFIEVKENKTEENKTVENKDEQNL